MQYDNCSETVAVQQWISSAVNDWKAHMVCQARINTLKNTYILQLSTLLLCSLLLETTASLCQSAKN
jgi:hypothetical protein